jgi:hypothetical protein
VSLALIDTSRARPTALDGTPGSHRLQRRRRAPRRGRCR